MFASQRPPYPMFLGGAARCAHRILDALSKQSGNQCVAVGSSDYAVTPWSIPETSEFNTLGVRTIESNDDVTTIDCGYGVSLVPNFMATLGKRIDAFRPDIVWAQLEGAKAILELARSKGSRTLFYVHDAEFDPAELRAIAGLDGDIVCSSKFLAGKVRKVTGSKASVVYPCPTVDFGVTGDPAGYLTMINPHRVKGVDTFFEIASKLPAERFLIVESWKLADSDIASLHARLAETPNVRFERRVSDMRQVYGRTKLLLVPSIWEEGFGMVAVEAQSCGIPVIASARGGLPESVGDGGLLIDDYKNADAWIDAIRGTVTDKRAYTSAGARARRHAAKGEFSASVSARRFQEVCTAPVRTPRLGLLNFPAAIKRFALPIFERLARRYPR